MFYSTQVNNNKIVAYLTECRSYFAEVHTHTLRLIGNIWEILTIKCYMLYRYEMTANPIWWPDIVQVKDRQKYVTCRSKTEQKTFNIKVSTCTTFLSFFFSVQPVLRGHSVFSSPPQQPMTSNFEGFLYQILSITLFPYLIP